MTLFHLISPILPDGDFSENDELLVEAEGVSDGHHTMSELYEHRFALFAALCKIYDNYITPFNTRVHCWKSLRHHDDTMYTGWFIAGMTITQFDTTAKQLSYHLPLSWWDKFNVIEMEKAPEYDGHNSNDVLKRLGEL